ncbi:OST2 [[Candida] subhashii]|uniref:Dolichyl-diphosphooligosaccharide--protein glycosyltransferase subunit OST2 n=1 Tax=[Candida] subhashii TaxID=561895 RepID=A0A8J5QTA1_9ASCO|nr:OST2 [[Candida] subhashii]KAG7662305.1 OST2 [[Candida] subhashii]
MPKQEAAIKKAVASTTTATGGHAPVPKGKLATTINELTSAVQTTIADYEKSLTPRLKLIDIFLVFLVVLGVLQFIYVLLVGNFPFNAFLGGFISCVGQFVLLVSLRLQINEKRDDQQKDGDADDDIKKDSKAVFDHISPERSFGDFIFASLILHFIVIHFIN